MARSYNKKGLTMTDTVDNSHGFTPGRKIKAALLMSVCLLVSAAGLSYIATPPEIVKYVLGIQGLGWIGVILGQSGIDALAQWASTKKPAANG